jgi:hypothetical protein
MNREKDLSTLAQKTSQGINDFMRRKMVNKNNHFDLERLSTVIISLQQALTKKTDGTCD